MTLDDEIKNAEACVMTLDDEIQEAEACAAASKERLAGDTARLESLLLLRIAENYGVSIGDTVTTLKGRFVVTSISTGGRSKPFIRGSLIKKDGTVSGAVNHLYDDWKLDRRFVSSYGSRSSIANCSVRSEP